MKKLILLFASVCIAMLSQAQTGDAVTGVTISQYALTVAQSTKPFKLYASVLPETANIKDILWFSSDINIATVNEFGEVTPKNPGGVSIYAKSKENPDYYAQCELTITKIPVTGVQISQKTMTLQTGRNGQLSYKIFPSYASRDGITWTTPNSNIADISSDGLISAHEVGTAKLIIYDLNNPDIADTCELTIVDEQITANEQIQQITMSLEESAIKTFNFADFFEYTGNSNIKYSVYNEGYGNNSIKAVSIGNSFGIVAYKTGQSMIFISAETETGLYASSSMYITVTSNTETPIDMCNNLDATFETTPVSCFGKSDGSAKVIATGGKAPYTYKWANYRTDDIITNMPSGYYPVIITDANGCIAERYAEITEKPQIEVTPQITPPTCGVANGKIAIDVVGGEAPYNYTWKHGSTNTTIDALDAGIYTIIVTDKKGCEHSKSFELNNSEAPIIIVNEITETTCSPNNGTVNIQVIGGAGNYSYVWNDNISILNRTDLSAGEHFLTVTDDNLCKASVSIYVPAKAIAIPDIALVTVGEESRHNLVIWEKEQTDAINFYTIYRETAIAGKYEELEKISYNLGSISEDTEANPIIRSYRYRLSATNHCGIETPLSAIKAEFKTINATIEIAPDSVVLKWDSAEGFDYYSYIIYKVTANGKTEIARVAANVNTYTVYTTTGSSSSYIIGVEIPKTLDPNGILKAESGPFILAMSNIAEAETSISSVALHSIRVFPTTVTDNISIDFSKETKFAQVSIINAQGIEVISVSNRNVSHIQIPVSNLISGNYIVQVTTETETIATPVVIK